MAHVHANGVRLHVQRLPQPAPDPLGPPLVLIHGLVDTLASWYFTLAGPLADLGFDVIAYDLRGHGRSERPATGYSVGDAIEDLAGLLSALGIDRPVRLVGNSLGGTIAFGFAERYPDRVDSLVVIESEPATPAWAARTADGLREVSELMLDEEVMAAQPAIAHRVAAAALAFDTDTKVIDELVDPRWLLDADRIRRITAPVLLLVGGESALSRRWDEFVPLLPDCRVEVVPGSEHLLLVTEPHRVTEIVLPWLAGQLAEPVA
jgi:pimeloyl-ACP methyl ester carboxylesterase